MLTLAHSSHPVVCLITGKHTTQKKILSTVLPGAVLESVGDDSDEQDKNSC